MGRCCLDGYGWSNPDTRKATARCLCIPSTTQPLYQGDGNPENEARRVVCQVELQFLLLERKVASLIPERIIHLSRLQAHGNDCTMQCAYACCVQIVKDVADLE